jgi:hypothetical protein
MQLPSYMSRLSAGLSSVLIAVALLSACRPSHQPAPPDDPPKPQTGVADNR